MEKEKFEYEQKEQPMFGENPINMDTQQAHVGNDTVVLETVSVLSNSTESNTGVQENEGQVEQPMFGENPINMDTQQAHVGNNTVVSEATPVFDNYTESNISVQESENQTVQPEFHTTNNVFEQGINTHGQNIQSEVTATPDFTQNSSIPTDQNFNAAWTENHVQEHAQFETVPQQTLEQANEMPQQIGNPQENMPNYTANNTANYGYGIPTQPQMPQKSGSKKKLWIILGSIGIVLSLLVGVYGFGVYNKSQKLNELKSEQKKLETSKDNLTKLVVRDKSMIQLNAFATCYQKKVGVNSGRSFDAMIIGRIVSVYVTSKEELESKLTECTPKDEDLEFEGAATLVNDLKEEIRKAFSTNAPYGEQANKILKDWNAFIDAARKSGGGELDSATYDNIRNLAAAAMDVLPSTIGNELTIDTVFNKVKERFSGLSSKETVINGDKVTAFIKAHSDGVSIEKMGAELKTKSEELKEVEDELTALTSRIKTKQSEVWNPTK